MIGENAIYLAKKIAELNMSNMNETQQVDTLKKNETLVRSFKYAVDDMATMMYNFMDTDRRSNLYGYKMKFYAIETISSYLNQSIDDSAVWFDACGKSFNKIAYDLEEMAKILDHEINNNMTTIDSRDKSYKKMPREAVV